MKNARLLIQDLITVFEREKQSTRRKKNVNEMFIIIEFILLAETLENTVHDSTFFISRQRYRHTGIHGTHVVKIVMK